MFSFLRHFKRAARAERSELNSLECSAQVSRDFNSSTTFHTRRIFFKFLHLLSTHFFTILECFIVERNIKKIVSSRTLLQPLWSELRRGSLHDCFDSLAALTGTFCCFLNDFTNRRACTAWCIINFSHTSRAIFYFLFSTARPHTCFIRNWIVFFCSVLSRVCYVTSIVIT